MEANLADQPTCRLFYLLDDQHVLDAVRRAQDTGSPSRHASDQLISVLRRIDALTGLGFTCEMAFADEAAIRVIAAQRPVLVIFDVLHSLRRARRVQARLIADPAAAAVPLIMLTNDEFVVNDGELKLTWPIRKSEGVSPLTMFAARVRGIPPKSMPA
ncbi:MAG: hypothetical protein IT184_09400 [Acidobacteria bacterium]|nr:hypothetical protein [Acidobacteriota bacterium]